VLGPEGELNDLASDRKRRIVAAGSSFNPRAFEVARYLGGVSSCKKSKKGKKANTKRCCDRGRSKARRARARRARCVRATKRRTAKLRTAKATHRP
jgi:hypothetical protein